MDVKDVDVVTSDEKLVKKTLSEQIEGYEVWASVLFIFFIFCF